MKIVINGSDNLSVDELMVLYLFHNNDNIEDIIDNITDNYFDNKGKLNDLGIIEYRNIEVKDVGFNDIKGLANAIRDKFRNKKPGVLSTLAAVSYKLKVFKEIYTYSDHEILKAVDIYLKQQEESGYQYLQIVDRFILNVEKGIEVSKLASYCDELNGQEEEDEWDKFV